MRSRMSVRKTAVVVILTAVLMNCIITTLAQANTDDSTDDWTMFNHDAKHTGFSQSTVPKNSTISGLLPIQR